MHEDDYALLTCSNEISKNLLWFIYTNVCKSYKRMSRIDKITSLILNMTKMSRREHETFWILQSVSRMKSKITSEDHKATWLDQDEEHPDKIRSHYYLMKMSYTIHIDIKVLDNHFIVSGSML